jgi:transposase
VTADVEDFGPGPLPVIGAMCRECGLCDIIDEFCEWDDEQVVLPPRYRLTALIMNFLMEGQPMYRLPKFFRDTDTENLFGDGVTPENLNDDAMARFLDMLAETDLPTLLGTMMTEAAAREGVATNVVHADTTSKSVQGLYEDEDDEYDLSITQGYSRDGNRHLNQFQIGLAVNREGVPVLGDIFDGNASDSAWNTELIGELRQRLAADEPPVYVADSAVMCEDSLDEAAAEGISIISRLPRTYSAVDTLIDRA